MAIDFVYETGEGLSDANSYLSTDEFLDFAFMLGYDVDTSNYDDIERKLMRGTLVLDSDFRNRFPGTRATITQALEFPRNNAYYIDGASIANNVIPKEIKMALTELFFLIESGTNLQPTIDPSGNLSMERIKVDSIEEERRYMRSGGGVLSKYKVVEDALSRITGGLAGAAQVTLHRAGGQF